jgi:hypothetical protein
MQINGAFSLRDAEPVNRSVRMVMDEVFRGASADVDPATLAAVFPSPEAQAGERLRQTAASLPIFVFGP